MDPKIPLKYPMWANQHHIQDLLQSYAEELFQEISPKLKPKVFLLGILRDKKKDSKYIQYPICIQPEKCGINIALFNDVDRLADSIWKKNDQQNISYNMSYIYTNHYDQTKRNSVRSAIQQLIYKNFEGKKLASLVSQSVDLEGYEVFVILQFEENIYNSFVRFKKTRRFSNVSLFDSLIWVFLEESLDILCRSRISSDPQSIATDKIKIIQKTVSTFVSSVIYTVCGSKESWNFSNICNCVSSLKYEGVSNVGKMIVCKEKHPNLELSIKLTTSVKLSEYGKIRKLLEITSRDLSLYSNGLDILGLGKIKGEYDEKNQDLIKINFSGSHKWKLEHGNHTMLVVERGNPRLPKTKIDPEVFENLLKHVFVNITTDDIKNLQKITNAAIMQKHGALLIISNDAKKEACRLKNQSTNIESIILNESLIKHVISIDGAVIFDMHRICHSIGVILDGTATNKEDSARGARYNSAVRYVEQNNKKCIAIIISEDGMVDLYPKLLPKI